MKNIILFSWLAALLLSLPAMTHAQTWTASAPEDGGTYYLYNVGKQAFMKGATNWDTRATLTHEGGIPFTLVSSGSAYYVSSAPTYANRFLGYDGYVDKESSDGNYTSWVFTPVEGRQNTYTLKATKNDKYWLVGRSSDFKTTRVTSLPTDDYGYWQLVKREDVLEGLKEATLDHPVDATLLLQNPYFGRVTDISCWQGSPAHGGNGEDGGNFCAEKWNTTFDVYQTLTGMPNGVYKMHCQGFYRVGDGSNDPSKAAAARNDGNEVLNAKYYINDTEGTLMSVFEYTGHATQNSTYTSSTGYPIGGETYYVPTNMTRAAMCFVNGEYTNPDIRVVVTDGTIRLGVKKTVANDQDWTIFDNFVLTYYGIDMTAMLEQSMTTWHAKYDAIVNQAADHSAFDAVLAAAEATAPLRTSWLSTTASSGRLCATC